MSKLGSFSIAGVTCMAVMSFSRRVYCVDVLTGTSGMVMSPGTQLKSNDVDGEGKLCSAFALMSSEPRSSSNTELEYE